jgi:hypothetical protein
MTYQPLRDNAGLYEVLGESYPSVTTILKVLDKPALVKWAARTAAELVLKDPVTYSTPELAAQGIYGKREKAAERGTGVHEIAEMLALDKPLPPLETIDESQQGYCQALLGFWRTAKPEVLISEAVCVGREHRYAGTCDLIAAMGDELVMLDYKTGRAAYREASLQLSAYRGADSIFLNGSLQPMVETVVGIVVLLAPDGSWRIHRQPEIPLEVFLACKRLYEWTKIGS